MGMTLSAIKAVLKTTGPNDFYTLKHADDGSVESVEIIQVRPFPTVAELATSLNCSEAEIMALSAEDRGGLLFDLSCSMSWE